MKTTFILLLFIHIQIFSFQGEQKIGLVKKESQRWAKALQNSSYLEISNVFATDAVLLPEYHSSLWGINQIQAYYTQFFEKTQTSDYHKEPFEILQVGQYYVESGTFEHRYSTPKTQDFEYKGKYMTYWEFQEDGIPKIIAHIWGASHYFEADMVDFITVASKDRPTLKNSTPWEQDIEALRKTAYHAVLTSNTEEQMKSYAGDANYMTYYDPPFIGKEQITAYFKTHNNPEVKRDSLMTRTVKVIDMENYALKFGEYHVEWTWEEQPSYIKGKGLALYKRMKDGSIKIFRQMINHSMPASPKK